MRLSPSDSVRRALALLSDPHLGVVAHLIEPA